MNAFGSSCVGGGEEKPESKVIENQFFKLVRAIENLVANGFFAILTDFDLTNDTVNTLSLSLTSGEAFLVRLGGTQPFLHKGLLISFFKRHRHPHFRILRNWL